MKNIGYFNGAMGPLEEMTIPMNDRAVYFGDGIYEAALTVNRIPFGLEPHLDRLYSSARTLRIPFTMPRETLKAELMRVVDAWGSDAPAMLYWQVTRGTAPRDHNFPEGVEPNLLITIKPYYPAPMEKTLRLITTEDTRHLHCNMKTLNLIPNVMASQLAKDAGVDECVFHRGDTVTECAHSNIHILKGGRLVTHAADNLILPGITRMCLLQLARENGVPVEESAFTVREMLAADEIIVTAAGGGVHGVTEIDGKPVGGGDPALLRKLQVLYYDAFDRATARQ